MSKSPQSFIAGVGYPEAVDVAGSVDSAVAASLVSAAADLSLLVDTEGRVQRVRLAQPDSQLETAHHWVGRPLSEVVTEECRDKAEALLADARAGQPRKWRHLNHPIEGSLVLPVQYGALLLSDGQVLVYGRDLRSVTELQQRLVESHQAMERDYQRMRQIEARYRLLFESSPEPTLVVDAVSRRVLELNVAAERALAGQARKPAGRALSECIAEADRAEVESALSAVLGSGRAQTLTVGLGGSGGRTTVHLALFRQESQSLFLVRFSPEEMASSGDEQATRTLALEALAQSPDGFVVTDANGTIVTANQAFAELVQLAHPNALLGESLDRWLGRSGVDLSVLLANLRQRGSVRLFATTLRGEGGLQTRVEMSARAVHLGGRTYLSFGVRDVATRLEEPSASSGIARSASQLTELVGRVPLKDIVGETAELIEKLCIEAALELTRDNRASAAEMLGLSRQSLYVKLRQYGLGDLGDRPER